MLSLLALHGQVHAHNLSSLTSLLSSGSIVEAANTTSSPRWSEYEAPSPTSVVHPATVADVAATVKWANENDVPFLTYNGGNGWATDFTLDHCGIYIALDLLDSVTFNSAKTVATIGGGALTSDVSTAGYAAGSLVATGTCDCVGFLGALLGGGIGYLTGEHGLLVDTVLSLQVVLADGTLESVTASSNPDLWWALRGAGPNFGIVVGAEVHAYPTESLTAWQATLVFLEYQLDDLLAALGNLTLPAASSLTLLYVSEGGTPAIIVELFYHGTADQGTAAFASVLAVGPVSTSSSVNPWTEWNSGSATACVKGGYKPTWAAGLADFSASAFSDVFDIWNDLVTTYPDAADSDVILNWYPMAYARTIPESSAAVAFRDSVSLFPSITVSYTDPSFNSTAITYGQEARAVWQANDGIPGSNYTYINNGFGDEPLETIYGENLAKLQRLKLEYDPYNRFNQWFPLLGKGRA
ncbi:hypothetical protein BD289DRAFT_370510 [Coniella lustricola]|uniref:FAD-binding PCMH-type domain-containing protein n=1 Tax=Coniella lustricola TaxID=2025994 RepID=A0A2T3A575_9PEZI|nr:hypothetical protein BD289DRAFT_370510 [Coniella lustricola]